MHVLKVFVMVKGKCDLLCISTGQMEANPWAAGDRRCGSPYHKHHTQAFWSLLPVV